MGALNTLTPTQLKIICVTPWRYGDLGGEWGESFVCARVVDFAPMAAFNSPAEMISLRGLVKKILIIEISLSFI